MTSPSTAALLTPPGRGAVATIRFTGDCRLLDESEPPLYQLANSESLSSQPTGNVLFAHWGTDISEDVVLCRQSKQILDIHCHGGNAATNRILNDLKNLGVQIVAWEAIVGNACSCIATELQVALSRATTTRTAGILLEQQNILEQHLETLHRLPQCAADWSKLHGQLEQLLYWSEFGLHLTSPWNVVLAGRVNVGKSSLLNALAGFERTIVFDQPGTTRDVVHVDVAFDGWPVQLSDTAGLRVEAEHLEREGMARAQQALQTADCQLLLIDISQPPQLQDWELIENYADAILVAHKCDLPSQWGDAIPQQAVPVSSLTRAGILLLIDKLVARLLPSIPATGTPLPVTQRQVNALQLAFNAVQQENSAEYFHAMDALLSR